MSDPKTVVSTGGVSDQSGAVSASPAVTAASPVAIHITLEQLKQLLAPVVKDVEAAGSAVAHGSIAGAAQEVVAAGKAVVADVKKISWSHVYAVVASTAAMALHLFPSLLKLL